MTENITPEEISRIVSEVVQKLQQPEKDIGLRGITVASSNICLIKGKEGQLYYRGFSIEDLAKNSTYEEVAFLLLYGNLPNRAQLKEFSSLLVSNRDLPREIIEQLQITPPTTPSMSVLQSTLALLGNFDHELPDESQEANQRKATRIIAKVPTVVAAWERIRNNQLPTAPEKTLSHAANFLYMLKGVKPKEEITRLFDIDLVLHAEHAFNASTFTARVIASTGADIYTALSGAIGSLAGKLHGGAVTYNYNQLLDIGDVANVETWVKTQFDTGKRVMGMGHAVYKTMDPRATIIKGMAEDLIQKITGIAPKLLDITNKLVEVTQEEFKQRKGREIYPNVDLYTPSVYAAIGIPVEAFAPIFTISRVAGWAAHVLEQQFPEAPAVKPALYRPRAEYIGEYCGVEGCPFLPLEMRNKQFEIADLTGQIVAQELQKIQQDQRVHYGGEPRLLQEKDLITERDIQELSRKNMKELHITTDTIITPLARDRARELGIQIIVKG